MMQEFRHQNPSQASQPQELSHHVKFAELLDTVRKSGLSVREFKFCGPQMVIGVGEERHDAVHHQATFSRIRNILGNIEVSFVGWESYLGEVKDIESSAFISGRVPAIHNRTSKNVTLVDEVDGGRIKLPSRAPVKEHASCWNESLHWVRDKGIEVIGIEANPEAQMGTTFLLQLHEFSSAIIKFLKIQPNGHITMKKASVAPRKAGKRASRQFVDRNFNAAMNGVQFLTDTFGDILPDLRLPRLKQSNDRKFYYDIETRLEFVTLCHKAEEALYVIGDLRNKAMADEIQKQGRTSPLPAVAMMGAKHYNRNPQRPNYKVIQDYLEDLSISYIIID